MTRKLPILALVAFTLLCATSCIDSFVNRVTDSALAEPTDTANYERRELTTGAFDRIACMSYSIITYHQLPESGTPHVTLRARPEIISMYTMSIEDSTLRIWLEDGHNMSNEDISLIDIYAPAVRKISMEGLEKLDLGHFISKQPLEIKLDGAGHLAADTLESASLDISIDGAGEVNLNGLRTGAIQADMNGVGSMNIAGTCDSARFRIDGAGSIDISALRSTHAILKEVNGSGHIRE